MLHNPTVLGFSLLILSCASPALGVSTDASSGFGLLDTTSTPSSPSLGINPSLPGFNPQEPVPTSPSLEASSVSAAIEVVTPTVSSSTPSVNAAVSTPSQTFATKGAMTSLTSGDSSALVAAVATAGGSRPYEALNPDVENQTSQLPAAPSALYYHKHNKASPFAHKKLAAKLKSINPPAPVDVVSLASSSSASSDTSISSVSVTPSISSSTGLITIYAHAPPISRRRGQWLGLPQAFWTTLIPIYKLSLRQMHLSVHVGELSSQPSSSWAHWELLGVDTLFQMRCLPCCHRRNPHRRSRRSLELLTEEGLRRPPRAASIEKSIIPGAPPMRNVDLPVLPSRDSHTPSCSTCPDSLNGMRSGISGGLADWRVYATNHDGQFEDVTHILSSDAFSVRSAGNERLSTGSWSARNSTASTGSGSEPQSSVHSRSASRTSESGASMTAESYKSCESRYSTPSFERHSRDGPPPSASASAASSLRSPSPSALLLRTPVQADYTGLANAALPVVVNPDAVAGPTNRQMATVVESEAEDMELDSQWDVAKAYASTPAKKAAQSAGVGRRMTSGVTAMEPSVGTVDLGGRTCVLMRG